MNTLFGSIVRKVIEWIGGFIVAWGVFTPDEGTKIIEYVIGFIISIAPILWSAFNRWRDSRKKLQ